ncbi:hypothetical protein Vafri_18065 [Volvox africanus]|nr:hypothetical protein Vafri_18065 [Volvox africanus]
MGGGRSLLTTGSLQQQQQQQKEEEEEEEKENDSPGNAVDAVAVTHFTNPAAVAGRPRRMGAAASAPTATSPSPETVIAAARARKRRLSRNYLLGRVLQQQTPSTANFSSFTSSLSTTPFYSWQILTAPTTGGNATIINATMPEALVMGISPGLYEFELVLKDNNGNTNSARANVLVTRDPWAPEAPPLPTGPASMSPPASITMPAPSPVPPAPTGKLSPPMPVPVPSPMPGLPSGLDPTAERYFPFASVPLSAPPPRPSPVLASFEAEVTLPIALSAKTTLPAVRGAILQLAYNYLTVPVRFQAGMPNGSCAQGPQAALATALAYPLRLPAANISTVSCQSGSGAGGSGSFCDAVAAVQAVLMFKVDPATVLESFKTAVFNALSSASSSRNGSINGLCPVVEGETDASTAAPGCMVRAISTPDSSFSDCQAFVSVLLPAMDTMVQTVLDGSGSSLVIMRTQCRATIYSNGVKAPSPAPPPGPPPALPVDAGKANYVSTDAIGDGARSSDDNRNGSGGGGGSKAVVIGVAAACSVVLLSALLVLLLCCRRRRIQERAAEDETTRQGAERADEVPDLPAQLMSTSEDYAASGGRHWLLFFCFRRSNRGSRSGGSWRGARVAPEDKKLRDEGDVELAATGTELGGIGTEGGRKEGFMEEGLSVASAGGSASTASAGGPAAGTDAAMPMDPARSVDSDMLLMATARLPTEDSAAAAELPSGALPPGLVPPEPTILMPPSTQSSDISSGIRANNGVGDTIGGGTVAPAAADDGGRSTGNDHVGPASSVLSRSSVQGMEHTREIASSWPELVGSSPAFEATEQEIASLKISAEPSTSAPPSASEPSVVLPAVATATLAAQPPKSPLPVGEPTVGSLLALEPATAPPNALLSTVSSQPAAEMAAPMALSLSSLTNQSVAPSPHVAPASPPVRVSLISPVSAAGPRLSVLPPIAAPLEHLPQLDPVLAPRSLGARLILPVTVPQHQHSAIGIGGDGDTTSTNASPAANSTGAGADIGVSTGGIIEDSNGAGDIIAALPSVAGRRSVLPSLAMAVPMAAVVPGIIRTRGIFAKPSLMLGLRQGSGDASGSEDNGDGLSVLPPQGASTTGSPSGGTPTDLASGTGSAVAIMTNTAASRGNSMGTPAGEKRGKKEPEISPEEEGTEEKAEVDQKRKLTASISGGSRRSAADAAAAVHAAAVAAATAAVASASPSATAGGRNVRTFQRAHGPDGGGSPGDEDECGAVTAGNGAGAGGAIRQFQRPGSGEASSQVDDAAAAAGSSSDADRNPSQGALEQRSFRRPDGALHGSELDSVATSPAGGIPVAVMGGAAVLASGAAVRAMKHGAGVETPAEDLAGFDVPLAASAITASGTPEPSPVR